MTVTHSSETDFPFAGSVRLYGEDGFSNIRRCRFTVAGAGGVGSWAVEALIRAGACNIRVIDGDLVEVTNINRQVHATTATVGMPKTEAMKKRALEINPDCRFEGVHVFLSPQNIADVIGMACDCLIDAIDSPLSKAHLMDYCLKNGIKVVTCGSAGGKTDPVYIGSADITRVEQEPLLAKVKKILRRQYGFPRDLRVKFGIDAVYSSEPVDYRHAEGDTPAGFGTGMAVTACFGLTAAAKALKAAAEGFPGK